MKTAIVWDWNTPTEDIMNTWDGPLSTYNAIAKVTETRLFTGGYNGTHTTLKKDHLFVEQTDNIEASITHFGPDFIFCWGSFDRPWHRIIHHAFPEITKSIRFSGGDKFHEASKWFDTIFCETTFDIEQFNKIGVHNVKFGSATAIDTFKPLPYHKKKFKAIYPTSLCAHKRIDLFVDSFGDTGLLCGRWNEEPLLNLAKARGTHVLPRVPSETLAHLYNMSEYAACTAGAFGGGARMVLEAMSCGVPPVVSQDNEQLHKYIEDSGFGHIVDTMDFRWLDNLDKQDPQRGRDYVYENYSPVQYADLILESSQEGVSG